MTKALKTLNINERTLVREPYTSIASVPIDTRKVHKAKGVKDTLNIGLIEEEYSPEFDIFIDEPNLTYQIKRIIFEELDITERRIILLYAEKGSMRETGKALGISTSKTHQLIQSIREKIKSKLNEHNS